MRFNNKTERWEKITDADVRKMARDGFCAAEIAAIAKTTLHVAYMWIERAFAQGVRP